jgi:hypothetical protein
MFSPTACLKPPAKMPSVQASLYFLKKDPLHLTEKPYAFRYQIEDDSIRQSNMEMERKDSIAISDIRRREKPFSIESNGIAVFQLKSQMSYEDFYNPDKVSIYLRELELLLKAQLKATHVEVFRYGVSLHLSLD